MRPIDPGLAPYLASIRKLERIGAGEEAGLLSEARNGSIAARNRLIRAHLRFILKVALHYRSAPIPVSDLIGEGVLGMIRAIEKYEPGRVRFLSYAVWWIRCQIVRAIEDRGALVRISSHGHARLRRERKRGRPEESEGYSMHPIQAEAAFALPASECWEDCPDPSPAADALLAGLRLDARIRRMLADLPWKEAFVLRNVYGIEQEEGDTLEKIGWDLGLSPERIRQLRETGLRRLREHPGSQALLAEWR